MLIFHVFFNGFWREGREAERTPCAFSSCFIVDFERWKKEGGHGRPKTVVFPGGSSRFIRRFPRVFWWFLRREGGRAGGKNHAFS